MFSLRSTQGSRRMTTVSRAAYANLQAELHEELLKTVTAFGQRHGVVYDRARILRHSSWLEDTMLNILGFGFDLWPEEDVIQEKELPHTLTRFMLGTMAIVGLAIEAGPRLSDLFSLTIDAVI